MTCRTSLGKPTIVNTTSEASATALGEPAHFAPFARSDSAFSLRRLKIVAAKPADIRCPTMLDPITPVPIQPMRVLPGAIVSCGIRWKYAREREPAETKQPSEKYTAARRRSHPCGRSRKLPRASVNRGRGDLPTRSSAAKSLRELTELARVQRGDELLNSG